MKPLILLALKSLPFVSEVMGQNGATPTLGRLRPFVCHLSGFVCSEKIWVLTGILVSAEDSATGFELAVCQYL